MTIRLLAVHEMSTPSPPLIRIFLHSPLTLFAACRRNEYTKTNTRQLYYVPWDSWSALADQTKTMKLATHVKGSGDAKKVRRNC